MAGETEDDVREDETGGGSEPPADLDAMGRDKRRGVVGGQYGASARKQLTVYGIALGVVLLLVVGGLTVVRSIDNRDMPLEDTAPWSDNADLGEPRDLDFINNGPQNTIKSENIYRTDAPEK